MARALTGKDPATAIAMLFFALLLAGRSFSKAGATQIGKTRFAGSTITAQELELFAACTWPLDAKASGQHFYTIKAGFDADDASTGLAVVFFIALGVAVMFVDSCELAKEEEQRETEKDVPQSAAKCLAASDSQPLRFALMALSFLIFGLAFAFKSPLSDGSVECQRAPLLAAKHNALTSLDAVALEELMRLPSFGLQHHRLAVVRDGMSVLFLIAFVLLGALCLWADAFDMAAEVEHERRSKAGKEERTQEEMGKMQPRRDAHTSLGPPLPASCSIVALAFAIAMKIATTSAPTVCIRAPVLSAPEGPLTWMDGVAMAELLALPGVGHKHTHLAFVGDRAAIVFLLAFGLLAMAAAFIDFWQMLAEQEKEVPASCDDVARSSASAAMQDAVKSTEKQEQCLSYVSLTWRLVSCLVLLLSVVGAAVAALCDTAI